MIDELLRDALDSQVAPPAPAGTWDRVALAGARARRRRERLRAGGIVVITAIALVAGALVWAGLSSGGTPIRVMTEPTTGGPASGPASPTSPTEGVRLRTRASWQNGSAPVERVSIPTSRPADEGRSLVVFWPAGGSVCDEPQAFSAQATATSVEVTLWRPVVDKSSSCPMSLGQTYVVALPSALGPRAVVDGTTGRPLALLDASALLVPHVLPAGWRAETEQLTPKGSWTRCYGTCTATGEQVTTAQGTDVNDVLHAGLGQIDDVTAPSRFYLPNVSLADLPFTYGANSELHGQPIPASSKLSVLVDGHHALEITSWANLVVLWRNGSTWYAVATSRDRQTTAGPETGVGMSVLALIARGMAPAT
jgi:hypothetical protein